jgi:hypothetical protein
VPASVLLAVLAAAGLLALAPALVQRYDATERLAAERAQSTARVLPRSRRRRTVPGRRPVAPARPRTVVRRDGNAVGGHPSVADRACDWSAAWSAAGRSAVGTPRSSTVGGGSSPPCCC